MRKIATKLSFAVILLSALTVASQTPNWQWATGGTSNAGFESVNKVISDNQGNIVVAGYYYGTITLDGTTISTQACNAGLPFANYDLYIAKYDASGNLLWVNYPTGVDTNWYSQVFDLVADQAGNVYAYMNLSPYSPNAGVVFGNDTIRTPYSLIKFDPNGNVLWHSDLFGNNVASRLAIDNSGDVLLSTTMNGDTTTFDTILVTSPHPLGMIEMVFVKYDGSSGHAIWAKTFGGNGVEDPKAIFSDNSGNYYSYGTFACDTMFFNDSTYLVNTAPATFFTPADYFYAKFDNNGNVIWAKSIAYASAGFTNNPELMPAINNSGEFFLAGRLVDSALSIGSVSISSPSNFVVKMDVNGVPVWATVLGDTLPFPLDLEVDASGNLYLLGSFSADTLSIANTTLYNKAPGSNTRDIYIELINSSGSLIGAFSQGGDDNEYPYFHVNDNGSMYLSGGSRSNSQTFGSTTLTNPNYPNTHMFLSYSTPIITGFNELSNDDDFILYPNPASIEINILFKNRAAIESVSILNLLGETIYSIPGSNTINSSIDISKLPAGIYLIQLNYKTKSITRKFIKE